MILCFSCYSFFFFYFFLLLLPFSCLYCCYLSLVVLLLFHSYEFYLHNNPLTDTTKGTTVASFMADDNAGTTATKFHQIAWKHTPTPWQIMSPYSRQHPHLPHNYEQPNYLHFTSWSAYLCQGHQQQHPSLSLAQISSSTSDDASILFVFNSLPLMQNISTHMKIWININIINNNYSNSKEQIQRNINLVGEKRGMTKIYP